MFIALYAFFVLRSNEDIEVFVDYSDCLDFGAYEYCHLLYVSLWLWFVMFDLPENVSC